MKKLRVVFLGVLSCVAIFLLMGVWLHFYPNYKDRNALLACKNEEDVVAYFKRSPEAVYSHLDEMTYKGWRLPDRPITNKIIVYTRKTGMRYYIYIGVEGNVEFVYGSSS